MQPKQNIAILLAVLAMLIWAGNFIIARDVSKEIPPVSLNFYRWLLASIIILPIGFTNVKKEWAAIRSNAGYLFWVGLTGIAMFNTFVYIGAHYTSAINLALIGTTSSPVFSVTFASIFLKEKVGLLKILGLLFCIAGIVYLLCRGSIENLLSLQFTAGDAWVLAGAVTFAVYNILVKKKPATISSVSLLTVAFITGTLIVLPFYLYEMLNSQPVAWNMRLTGSIVYLGLGASVICFMLWNTVISRLGAGRASLFGNLIPVFTSLGAVLLLNEKFTLIHVISMVMVFTGILIANLRHK